MSRHLREAIGGLLTMDPQRLAAAEDLVEGLRAASREELQSVAGDLRLALMLAGSSCALWSQICGHVALDSAGYSALGEPAEPLNFRPTGAFCG